jgi:hypothetical protein
MAVQPISQASMGCRRTRSGVGWTSTDASLACIAPCLQPTLHTCNRSLGGVKKRPGCETSDALRPVLIKVSWLRARNRLFLRTWSCFRKSSSPALIAGILPIQKKSLRAPIVLRRSESLFLWSIAVTLATKQLTSILRMSQAGTALKLKDAEFAGHRADELQRLRGSGRRGQSKLSVVGERRPLASVIRSANEFPVDLLTLTVRSRQLSLSAQPEAHRPGWLEASRPL